MDIIRRKKNREKDFLHIPVLLNEVIKYLNPQPNQHFIDATVGGGGHAEKILKLTSPAGTLWGFDLDEEALKVARERLRKFKNRFFLFQANFIEILRVINEQSRIPKFSGFLLDLGLSSFQLQSKRRGFSFQTNGLLDMRFGSGSDNFTAADILNKWSENELKRILKDYGEERFSQRIAEEIVLKRKEKKFKTTSELIEIIKKVYRERPRPRKINPATKTFQALRIAVNDELNNLQKVLPQALKLLAGGGRLVVISFHSLEDRIVKQFFQKEAKDCLCPEEFPVCRCGHKSQLRIMTKKVLRPSLAEIKQNYRGRSAKLRAAEKL